MKKLIICFGTICLAGLQSLSQNFGIGTNNPLNKLQVEGSVLFNSPTVGPVTVPTAAQNKTMINASTISYTLSDSTGRIYDPGGPSGNYLANLTANASIPGDIDTPGYLGVEVTVESMGLGAGDSLIFKEYTNGAVLMAVGNSYNSTGKFVFNYGGLYIIFKSDADAVTGSGFSLLFRRLYDNSATIPPVTGFTSRSQFFDAKTGAFRSGWISNAARGNYSTALGFVVNAPGDFAFAAGNTTTASGTASVATGFNSKSTGQSSVAMGNAAKAFAMSAVAMGELTTASGWGSVSMGGYSTASGDYSVTLGKNNNASALNSIAIGNGTIASGASSTALGEQSSATAQYAMAMGRLTTASGISSTALGKSTTASGTFSTALGISTTASGQSSTATGSQTTASGPFSTAMGVNASTNNFSNSFCIGGTGTVTNCTAPNQLMTRFDNYTFWISASNYAYLLPSTNGWAFTSDRNKKEKFEELDGEIVLKKISCMPSCSWNFKAPDTRQYRHYGITAQDFYNAFGKDSYGFIGNDSTVSPLDMLGVAYSAIKALEKRSAQQQQQNTEAIKVNEQLRADNLALQKRLGLMEAKLNELMAMKENADKTGKSLAANK